MCPYQTTKGSVCRYIWDPEVVKSFKDDTQIRRMSVKSLLRQQMQDNKIECISRGHPNCRHLSFFKDRHPEEYERLLELSSSFVRSVFVPGREVLMIEGRKVQIEGGIKSLDPSCSYFASSVGNHPYTCKNCHSQLRYLRSLMKKRERAVYDLSESRISKTGFRSSYTKNAEVTCAFQGEMIKNEKMNKNVNRLIISASQNCKSWENKLLESCKRHDDAKLVLDLVSLFKNDVADTNSIQVEIIRNLVGKLK